jgi:hypothetical protein
MAIVVQAEVLTFPMRGRQAAQESHKEGNMTEKTQRRWQEEKK